MMTRKDYTKIADAFARARNLPDEVVWQSLLDRMIHILSEDNPRFDRQRFIEATQR